MTTWVNILRKEQEYWGLHNNFLPTRLSVISYTIIIHAERIVSTSYYKSTCPLEPIMSVITFFCNNFFIIFFWKSLTLVLPLCYNGQHESLHHSPTMFNFHNSLPRLFAAPQVVRSIKSNFQSIEPCRFSLINSAISRF